jgi:predicted DNA binding protein
MREAIVTVCDEDGAALGLEEFVAVFQEGDLGDIEVMSCEGSRGVVRVEVDATVDEDCLTELPAVTWWERVSRSGSGAAYLVEFDVQDAPNMIDACSGDLLLCGTIDVTGGDFTFDVAGPQETIADTIAAYEAAGANVGLESLRDFDHRDRPLDALTARQREVIQVAFDSGYFDVPRAASTAEVAADLELDTSTVSEHLQRAERNLLSTVLSPSTAGQ